MAVQYVEAPYSKRLWHLDGQERQRRGSGHQVLVTRDHCDTRDGCAYSESSVTTIALLFYSITRVVYIIR